jgi:23S rRNA (cytidine1920-2'-O)/16S rRNA (cytidine1409-2'-O)-methyltransferase
MGEATHSDGEATAGRPRPRERVRLDALLVTRGVAPSRERARALIMAGEVRVDGRMVDKPGTLVPAAAECALVGAGAELRYASRGGLKLEHALNAFGLDPGGGVCLDVGASTGGFTDVLLRRGAARVYAVDVGRGQLAWHLRADPRVVVMERTNVRYLTSLPQPIDCASIDVSFISLRLVLPPVAALLRPGGWAVALVKPQFEAGRAEADRGAGVISDPMVHRTVLRELLEWVAGWPARGGASLVARGLVASPIVGREGNREYLLWLERPEGDERGAEPTRPVDARRVDEVVAGAFAREAPATATETSGEQRGEDDLDRQARRGSRGVRRVGDRRNSSVRACVVRDGSHIGVGCTGERPV